MRKVCLMLAVLMFGFTMAAFAEDAKPADVAGDWNMSMMTPMGESTCILNFVQDGGNVTVKFTDPMGAELEVKGTVVGNVVKWSANSQTPMGEMLFEFEGTVDGDKIAGTATMVDMPMPPSDWTATR